MTALSGEYAHFSAGALTGVTESWEHDGNRLMITFDASAIGSYILDAEIIFDELIQIFTYSTSDGLSGSYFRDGDRLRIKRVLPGNTRLEDTLVGFGNVLLDLPFLSCKGRTILRMAEQDIVSVYAPLMRAGDRAGDLAKKTVTNIGTETINLDDKQISAQHYQYMRDYWIDENAIVLQATDELTVMQLVEYSLWE